MAWFGSVRSFHSSALNSFARELAKLPSVPPDKVELPLYNLRRSRLYHYEPRLRNCLITVLLCLPVEPESNVYFKTEVSQLLWHWASLL